MNYQLRPAITSEAKPLVGLYAESGKGKTKGALLLACGFVNGDMSKVAMIETESGRGEAYAADPIVGGYLVRPIRADFSPTEYGKAITDVEKSGAQVLIIDSASHEWEGTNGVLAQAAENQAAGKKGPLVWQMPKIKHQREFMLRLMQTPIPLVIVCMRAKYPMKEQSKPGKPNEKEWVRSSQLEPKQADDILFEMMVHAWIDDEHKLHVTKYTLDQMREIFLDGQPLTVDTGRRLKAWASGQPKTASSSTSAGESSTSVPDAQGKGSTDAVYITVEEALQLEARCDENGIDPARLKKAAKVERFSMILKADLPRANKWVDEAIAAQKQSQTV